MGTSRIIIRNVVKRAFAMKRVLLIVRSDEGRVVKTAVLDAARSIAHNLRLPLVSGAATEYQGKFVLLEFDLSNHNIEPFFSQAECFLNTATAGILLFDNVHNYDSVSTDLTRRVIEGIKGNKMAVLLSTTVATAASFDCEVFDANNKSATWIVERIMPHLTKLKADPRLLKLCAANLCPAVGRRRGKALVKAGSWPYRPANTPKSDFGGPLIPRRPSVSPVKPCFYLKLPNTVRNRHLKAGP